MQEKPAAKTKKRLPLANVAFLLIATALIGQVLGFLRTKLVNANFSATGPHSTDAYFAAFNIPDFFFYTLAAGALGVAFMPILAERLHKGDHKGMWELSNSLLNLLSMVMLVVAIIIFVFAEPLISHIVAPNLSPQQLDNASTIMRLLALNPLFFTISGILTSVQQTLGRFFFYAIAPLFYNLAIIASIYIFKDTGVGLVGLGIGAFVGGILQLAVVCFGLIGTKFYWRPRILWRSRDFRLILRNLPPRSLDQGMDQIQSIVETNFARRLGEGNISYYNNAYILQTAPVLLLGTAISTAAFPRMNARLAQGRPDLFRSDFLRVLRVMIWITLPVVIICYFTRGYLARLIFSRDSQEIALIFGFLTIAILFRTLYTIISRWFYAQKDTRTPLFVSVFTIGLNIILASWLARKSTYGVAGLALSQSIVAMTEVVVLFTIMLSRDHKLFDAKFWGGVLRIVSVSGFSLVTGFIMVSLYPLGVEDRGFVTLGTKLAFIAGATFVTHIAVSGLFGLEEVRPIFKTAKRIITRPIRLPY
ncbi:MAG TPA: murein biosynthesis integral membrane protein MurJ [Nevskiaceae bacterium]|nr:murein biosynthesis integral membrane protein MurJ [Nevskiaceae bacterium]